MGRSPLKKCWGPGVGKRRKNNRKSAVRHGHGGGGGRSGGGGGIDGAGAGASAGAGTWGGAGARGAATPAAAAGAPAGAAPPWRLGATVLAARVLPEPPAAARCAAAAQLCPRVILLNLLTPHPHTYIFSFPARRHPAARLRARAPGRLRPTADRRLHHHATDHRQAGEAAAAPEIFAHARAQACPFPTAQSTCADRPRACPAHQRDLRRRPARPTAGGLRRGAEPPRGRGRDSRRRDCHFTDIPSPSMLKHLLKREGGAAE